MEYKISDFREGDRVELHPATDLWMRGERYATVRKVGKKYLHLTTDHSGAYRVWPKDITQIF